MTHESTSAAAGASHPPRGRAAETRQDAEHVTTAAPVIDGDAALVTLLASGLEIAAIAAEHDVTPEEAEQAVTELRVRAGVASGPALVAKRLLDATVDQAMLTAVPRRADATDLQLGLLRLIAAGHTVEQAAQLTGTHPARARASVAGLLSKWHTTLEGAVAVLVITGHISADHLAAAPRPETEHSHEVQAAPTPPAHDPGHEDHNRQGRAGERVLMTGDRTVLDSHARAALRGARRAVLVLQDGDLAQALTHWRAVAAPSTRLLGIRGPGERTAIHRRPPGGPIVSRSTDLAHHLHIPGAMLLVATLGGAQVLAGAYRDHHLPAWDLLVVENALALDAAHGIGADLLSDHAIPAARRLLQSCTTRFVDGTGRTWTAQPGTRFGEAHRLGPGIGRSYRLKITLTTADRPGAGRTPLTCAVDQLLEAATRPDTRLIAVACPDERLARRLARHLETHPNPAPARGRAWVTASLTPDQSRAAQRAVLERLGRGAHGAVAVTEPTSVPSGTGALMLLAAHQQPWRTLAFLERALAAPSSTPLLLMTAPIQPGAGRRWRPPAAPADAVAVVRALAALDSHLRHRLRTEHAGAGEGKDPFHPGGALDWVNLPGDLPRGLRQEIGTTLLTADLPRQHRPPTPARPKAPPATPAPRPLSPVGRPSGPAAVLGRVVGLQLRRLRIDHGLSLAKVSTATGVALSSLSQIEHGQLRLTETLTDRLLTHYNADPRHRQELLTLCRQSTSPAAGGAMRDRGAWQERLATVAASAGHLRIAATQALPPAAALDDRHIHTTHTVLLAEHLLRSRAVTPAGRLDLAPLTRVEAFHVLPSGADEPSPVDVTQFDFPQYGTGRLYASADALGVLYRAGTAADHDLGTLLDAAQARALNPQDSHALLRAALAGTLTTPL
ncbi:helix-turn-helix domain-containing protein [Kitasatospora sp. NPDC059327]|uniref:helix-turn-helix domain-containing protein n=1 Tax=Kitasatospora sp. NPDC059327 TaxID=3346803 RepID=UPI0036AC102D